MKNIYERYGYYSEYINKIAKLKIDDRPTISSLGLDRGSLQMGYREMRELNFKGTIIDYISWIGFLFLLELWAEGITVSGAVSPKEQISLLNRLISDRPVDALNSMRVFRKYRPGRDTSFPAKCLYSVLFGENAIERIWTIIHAVFNNSLMSLFRFESKSKTNQPKDSQPGGLIKYYQSIQPLNHDSDPSFHAITTDLSEQSQPITPARPSPERSKSYTHLDKAPSDADNSAKRSEASSQKAPAGAAKKSRRATRPESTPPQHRSGETDAQPKSTRTSLK